MMNACARGGKRTNAHRGMRSGRQRQELCLPVPIRCPMVASGCATAVAKLGACKVPQNSSPVSVPAGQWETFADVQCTSLANGLTVLVLENPVVPLVTIEINVKNGAYTETAESDGLSHLYEHMFFKANAQIPDQETYLVIRGVEVIKKFRRELEYLNFARRMEKVEHVSKQNGNFSVRLENGDELETKAVIIATGTRQQKMWQAIRFEVVDGD